nr:MAG TPA: hypothetical protein [Caudoviricetes sp.]
MNVSPLNIWVRETVSWGLRTFLDPSLFSGRGSTRSTRLFLSRSS